MERNGKHWITVNRRRIAIRFSDGWIEFGGFDAPPPQHVPQDRHSYAYTHGGEVFQAACDLYWSFPA